MRDEALLDIEKGYAATFVQIDRFCDPARNIAGFFTLRAASQRIRDEDDPHTLIEVPLIELMYLARDLRWKRQRVGDLLLLDALALVAQADHYVGFIGLHLRSTNHGKRLYERHYFAPFTSHPHFDGMRYLLSIEFIRNIAAQLG